MLILLWYWYLCVYLCVDAENPAQENAAQNCWLENVRHKNAAQR